MQDMTYSVETVRGVLREGAHDPAQLAKARLAFGVVVEAYEAVAELLDAAINKQHDAELALSALRHPSESVDQLRQTLRQLAGLEDRKGKPLSPAFEQVLDELIAEVKLDIAAPPSGMEEQSRTM
jgi:hypothetical protein